MANGWWLMANGRREWGKRILVRFEIWGPNQNVENRRKAFEVERG